VRALRSEPAGARGGGADIGREDSAPTRGARPQRQGEPRDEARTMPTPTHAPLNLVALLLIAISSGCLEPISLDLRAPPDASTDAGPDASPPPALGALTVRDARGAVRDASSIPRSPRLHIALSGTLRDTESGVLLLRGAPDDALRADLATAPLRSDTLARAVPADLFISGDALEVTPRAPLVPGMAYTLAVVGWLVGAEDVRALGVPRAFELRVSTSVDDGAARIASWPPEGAPAIGPNLPLLATCFDGRVAGAEDAVFLTDEAGVPVPASTRDVPCEGLGWRGAHCVAVLPHAALMGASGYALVAGDGLRDATGAAISPTRTWFTTSTESDTTPPEPLDGGACAPDELALGGGCALLDDRSATVRIRASEPIRASLSLDTDTHRETAEIGARGDVRLALRDLMPDTSHRALLRLVDSAGLVVERAFEIATTPPLATIAITEIRADPRGSEPRQEYVEVINFGPVPVDLQGFSLSDRADTIGDVVTRSFVLPPGARALIVPEAFDPDDDADDAPAPGVPLLRLDGSLGSGGLANGGEPLFLRDAEGRRISAAPALAAPSPGACIVRASLDPRDGSSDAFRPDALGGCTPGLPDRPAPP